MLQAAALYRAVSGRLNSREQIRLLALLVQKYLLLRLLALLVQKYYVSIRMRRLERFASQQRAELTYADVC